VKVLLHAPLHATLWLYLMKSMPEHEYFIEPKADFEQSGFPRKPVPFTVISKSRNDIDVQIICLHLPSLTIAQILKEYKVPIVWIQYWQTSIPRLQTNYPLITTCQTDYSQRYPNVRQVFIAPHPDFWAEKWQGDEEKIFLAPKIYSTEPYVMGIINWLKAKRFPLNIYDKQDPSIPFATWKENLVHSRVLLEISPKHSSMLLSEAMTIGMPVIVPRLWDYPKTVRDKIDGFVINSMPNLESLLTKFLKDKDFAKEYGKRAEERAKELFSVEKQRKIFNEAMEEAINLGI
jgi:hypothetical protein